MIDAPSSAGSAQAKQRSGRKAEGASPGSRVCKSFSLQRLRSVLHASMVSTRQASEVRPTRAASASPDLLRSTDRERANSGEAADTVFDKLSRWGTGDAPSHQSTRSFHKEASGIERGPARPRGEANGGHTLHPVPESIVTYVRLLRGCPLRSFFILLWFTFMLSGASIYFPLTRILKISVEPPYGSESEAAKTTYALNFPPEPVTLVALISATEKAGANATLINPDAAMYPTLYPPFFGYDPTGSLTAETEAISIDLKRLVKPHLHRCEFNFYSFFDMPFEVQMVAHEFLFPSRWNGREGMIAVHLVSCDGHAVYKECVYKQEPFCEPVAQLLDDWAAYRDARVDDKVSVTFVSYPVVYEDIILGIEWGMALSTVATALAFIVLAVMLRNIRQLALVLANILCAIGTTLLIMYPGLHLRGEPPCPHPFRWSALFFSGRRYPFSYYVSVSPCPPLLCDPLFYFLRRYPISYYVMDVNVCAPAMLVAVALAMSIDYSLFLLTRFNEERANGRPITTALEIALATQGHTIIVSGATLALCFTSMLVLPTSTITSMAAGAATAVLQSVLVSLSLTPSLLLTLPRFFTSNRRLGLTLDGTWLGGPARGVSMGETLPAVNAFAAAMQRKESLWAALGRFSQGSAKSMALLLLLVAVPFAAALTHFTYVEDLTPLMQSTHPATDAFIKLGDTFGQDLSTPVMLLILAPSKEAMASREWSLATCHMLVQLAADVTAEMARVGYPEYKMEARDLSGLMIFNGNCLTDGLHWGFIDVMPAVHMSGAYDMVADLLSNREQTATQVVVHCRANLFSAMGEAWMRAVRASLPRPPVLRQPLGARQADPSEYAPYGVYDGVQIGALHLYGMPLEQMDGAQFTLRRMPLVALAIALIVCVVLGGSFGTVLIPVRAVICIAWMLIVTFGASVMVFQFGYLRFLGLDALAPASGQALFWISPSVAIAVLVGLGLDYDIFLMDSVMEHWNMGKGGRAAVIEALDQAGTIISAAGIIMFLAFGALGASTTPVLNQLGFMLCSGVLLDCFITTKVTIPCLMALVPDDANFWPLQQPPPAPPPNPLSMRDLALSPSSRISSIRRSLSWRWKYGGALEFNSTAPF